MTADLVTVVMGRVSDAASVRPTALRCRGCHGWLPDDAFSPDDRNARRRGRRSTCKTCVAAARPPRPGAHPTTLRQEQLRAWWMERYDMAEIREMAAALDFLSTARSSKETA